MDADRDDIDTGLVYGAGDVQHIGVIGRKAEDDFGGNIGDFFTLCCIGLTGGTEVVLTDITGGVDGATS